MGQDLFKGLTSSKFLTYPSSGDSVPIWQQETGNLLESEILNNSESIFKSDSANKIEVISDSHERKLQKILDYKKERELCEHDILEFGENTHTRKTDNSSLN